MTGPTIFETPEPVPSITPIDEEELGDIQRQAEFAFGVLGRLKGKGHEHGAKRAEEVLRLVAELRTARRERDELAAALANATEDAA